MKKKEKRLISILVLITIIVIIIGLIINSKKDKKDVNEGEGTPIDNQQEEEYVQPVEEYVDIAEDGRKVNKSDKIKETKKFEGMEFTNLSITESGNVTLLTGTVTNTSSEKVGGYPITIKVVDKEGNEIVTIGALIKELEPGESTDLNTSTTFDFANAYDFVISK